MASSGRDKAWWEALEREYCHGSRQPLRVDMHDMSYEISLIDFEQKNMKTGRRRAIRRRDDEEKKAHEATVHQIKMSATSPRGSQSTFWDDSWLEGAFASSQSSISGTVSPLANQVTHTFDDVSRGHNAAVAVKMSTATLLKPANDSSETLWQVLLDEGWHTLDGTIQQVIRRARATGGTRVNVTHRGFDYAMDLTNFKQINLKNQKMRDIRVLPSLAEQSHHAAVVNAAKSSATSGDKAAQMKNDKWFDEAFSDAVKLHSFTDSLGPSGDAWSIPIPVGSSCGLLIDEAGVGIMMVGRLRSHSSNSGHNTANERIRAQALCGLRSWFATLQDHENTNGQILLVRTNDLLARLQKEQWLSRGLPAGKFLADVCFRLKMRQRSDNDVLSLHHFAAILANHGASVKGQFVKRDKDNKYDNDDDEEEEEEDDIIMMEPVDTTAFDMNGPAATSGNCETSFTNVLDIFVTLLLKIGVWQWNVRIAWPITFINMTSWLQFPAIGWERALRMLNLSRNSWLYWFIFGLGVLTPLTLIVIILIDSGNVKKGDPFLFLASSFCHRCRQVFGLYAADTGDDDIEVESGVNSHEDKLEEVQYKAQVKRRAIKITITLVGTGAILAFGSNHNSQIVVLGLLLMFGAIFYIIWERLKLTLLEGALVVHNRSLLPAYRDTRIFICSTILLEIIRSLYIMTISGLILLFIQAFTEKRQGEVILLGVLLVTIVITPPVSLFAAAKSFEKRYIFELSERERMSRIRFRRFLDNFNEREVLAPMVDTVTASLLQPFSSRHWYFAVLQLAERALATILATTLASLTGLQLGAAICLECLCLAGECFQQPFTNKDENLYNLIFRAIGLCILTVAIIIEFLDNDKRHKNTQDRSSSFSHRIGDPILVSLTAVSFIVFIRAMDPKRVYKAYRKFIAVERFRNEPVILSDDRKSNHDQSSITLGELGQRQLIASERSKPTKTARKGKQKRNPPRREDLSNDDELQEATISAVDKALKKIPNDFRLSEIVTDALSHVQRYQLLKLADLHDNLNNLIIFYGIFLDVQPLITLAGAQLGGRIPRSIQSLVNVQKVLLSDMALEDGCGLEHMASLPRLQYLNLDGNLFTQAPAGLGKLKWVRKLSMANLKLWGHCQTSQHPTKNNKQIFGRPSSLGGKQRISSSPPRVTVGDTHDFPIKDNAFLLAGLANELDGMSSLQDFTFTFEKDAAVPPVLVEALWRLHCFTDMYGNTISTPKKKCAEEIAVAEKAISSTVVSPSVAQFFGISSPRNCSLDRKELKARLRDSSESIPPKGQALVATNFSPAQLKKGGHTALALKKGGFDCRSVRMAGFSAAECRGATFTADEAAEAGFSARQLRFAGWSGAGASDQRMAARLSAYKRDITPPRHYRKSKSPVRQSPPRDYERHL